MERKIFLLGGHDLEMIEIRKMLEENKIQYFDHALTWSNAYLKEYAQELDKYGRMADTSIYGIELQEKDCVNIPSNYIRIDHHNEMSNRPASIIQVAEVLNIPVSHYRQLVAANDSGYIPDMIQVGATTEEINAIRRKDREAQGVTEIDEELAEKAISDKSVENGIIIVKAYSSRFSPICDRLFPYDKLIIYTDDELMYYGEGKSLLVEKFTDEINAGKMFHGGGADGFIGTVRGAYSKEKIYAIKENIVSFLNS